jgi:hypothetical protein
MKKTLAILTICTLCASYATANADVYNSVSVDKSKLISAPKTLPSELPEITEVQDLPEFTPSSASSGVYYDTAATAKQNAKLQEALLKIDSAQVDVKNELNLYESKLVDVKNRENLVKQEKNGVMKEIRTVKKKMRSLESAKKNIVTNMSIEQGTTNSTKHFNWFK